jgi:hypothetical protein
LVWYHELCITFLSQAVRIELAGDGW